MSKLENVHEIIKRQGIRADMLKMMGALSEQSKASLIKATPRMEKEITNIVDTFMQRVGENFDSLEQVMIDAMMEAYNDEEVQTLVNFCRDPIGASIMKKSPMVTLKSHNIGAAWGLALMEKVVKELYPELLEP